MIGVCTFCILPAVGLGLLAREGGGAIGGVVSLAGCSVEAEVVGKSLLRHVEEKGVFPTAEEWKTAVSSQYELLARERGAGQQVGFGLDVVLPPAKLEESLVCQEQDPKTYLLYNSALAGKKLSDIQTPGNTWLVFESKEDAPGSAREWSQPAAGTAPRFSGQERRWIGFLVDGTLISGS